MASHVVWGVEYTPERTGAHQILEAAILERVVQHPDPDSAAAWATILVKDEGS